MTISIVMTTYNGGQYVLQQLVSISKQTVRPDEVLIFDDCSTDNTAEIIDQYIRDNQLENFKLSVNEINKGWKKNFAEGINQTVGDIVFLSDQDDVWYPSKIEEMCNILNTREEITLLASNYKIQYEEGSAVIRYKKAYEPYGSQLIEKVELNGGNYEPFRPGCVYAFRKAMINDFNLVWKENNAHDRILWDISLTKEGLYIYNKELITQIRHPGNNTPINAHALEGRIELIESRRNIAQTLLEKLDISEGKKEWLRQYIKTADQRVRAIKTRNVIGRISLLNKHTYYPRLIEWCIDAYVIVLDK